MKTLLFILLLSFSATAQTYVRVADKIEYERYKKWCNVRVSQEVEQFAKVTLIKVNGQYTDSIGGFYTATPTQISWYRVGTSSFMVQENETLISIKMKVPVRRRNPSIKDFYLNWQPYGKFHVSLPDSTSQRRTL